MSELAVIESDVAALDSLDPTSREVALTGILDQALGWLERAKMATDPARKISEFKAYIATVAETTKQLKVSRELQRDAEVMVRRSERALGVAIREGQERGEIRQRGGNQGTHVLGVRGSVSRTEGAAVSDIASPYDFAKHTELYGDGKEGGNGVYAMADATDEQFEEALDAAVEEKNVSRSNVVRKIREIAAPDSEAAPRAPSRTLTANSAHVQILDLARIGMGNAAIAKQVGVSANTVSEVVLQNPDVRAEREKLNILTRTVDALMGGTYALESLTEFSAIDPAQGQEWLDKLQRHMNAVKTVRNSIRKAMES